MRPEIVTPLRTEWLALRGAVRPEVADLSRTGRSRATTPSVGAGPRLVAGVAGGLSDDLAPGDLVVASEVRRADGTVAVCAASPLLVGALRRLGLTVHHGPVATSERIVDTDAGRRALADTGALAVDTESGLLVADDGSSVVLRAVVDTPSQPLRSLATVRGGIAALRSLRRAAPAVAQWAEAVGDGELLLAGPRSFCAGVERAIDIVDRALEIHGAPVYVRRQIVHNRHVVADLEKRGAVFVEEVAEVPEGSVVVLAAHGVAPVVRAQAAERDLRVVDATCPLVAKVHQEVRRYAAAERTVLLIGHHEHEEVVGTRGEAPEHVIVVADPEEAATVEVPDPTRLSSVMQTTLSVDEANETAAVLRQRFPALAEPHRDDICYATTNRQEAVRAVARDTDLVVVLGSQNSSSSLRLAEVAEAEGTTAYLVDDAESVDLAWLAGVRRIGITAGASAPPTLVQELVSTLSGLGRTTVTERSTRVEDISFSLPKEVSRA